MSSIIASAKAQALRVLKWGWLDHLIRTVKRYSADKGDRLAAAVTFYGYLSVFPILLLAVSVLGFLLHNDAQRQADVLARLDSVLPPDLAASFTSGVSGSRGATGLIGLAGLLLSGLGWIGALREALRALWHQPDSRLNRFVLKARDAGTLLLLGLVLVLSLAATALATAGTTTVAKFLLGHHSPVVGVLVRVLALVSATGVDVAFFACIFFALSHAAAPRRRVLRGALLAAVLFEAGKGLLSWYAHRLTGHSSQLYGAAVAAAFGLLIWLNLVSRLTLLAAVWTVTAPGSDDVAPSGTAKSFAGATRSAKTGRA